ncbi:MAG: von Willebrand factor type A domain-containing protein [Ruminiclostridium sp.]|nr:von Willebrand factor type A domain-containing protein [Ruminiclostridium sp.]
MKLIRSFAALTAAAAVAVSSMPAVSAGMTAFLTKTSAQTSEQTAGQTSSDRSYASPMTTNRQSARYKNFIKATPRLNQDGDSYWDTSISWSPVKDALLYYVYSNRNGRFGIEAKTTDTTYWCEGGATYFVRAVTYDLNDKRILGRISNKITVKADPYRWDDEEWDEGDYFYDYTPINSISGAAAPATEEERGISNYETDGADYDDDYGWEEAPDNEEYSKYAVDGFKSAAQTPLSTFSADVDTASYANARRMILNGGRVTPDAVRIEEFLNYFDYGYAQPEKGDFSVTYEYTDCPWNKDAKLLMLGVQAKDIETEPASNLVFLVDVSGSMYSQDKLPLVVESLKKLTAEMSKNDRISIVTYSGEEKVVIAGARGNMRNCIGELADTLTASGCTNGEAGINMAYDIAARYYKKNGSNRVILATDGDLNVGISDKDELSEFIAKKRGSGIYLTVLGFGTGNLKDDRMEALAKDGNGNYHYIDCAAEASKVLVDERKATLITVADDVKLQVEFNPTLVDSYRLIGYDGRRLANEDFTDDKKDAADMGAGQSVTVMYEIIPAKDGGSSLQYQSSKGNKTDICTLKCRYKKPGASASKEFSVAVKAKDYCTYAKTGIRFKFAACVTELAMALRGEKTYGNVSIKSAKARFDKLSDDELAKIGWSEDLSTIFEELTTRR